MQFDVLFKVRHAPKFLERGFFHLRHVRESHVIGNQRQNLPGVIFRKTQALADFTGHLHADIHMIVEANTIRRHAERRRLADIMQESAPRQRRRTRVLQFLEQQQSVYKHVAFGMKLRWLPYSLHRGDLRQDFAKQTGFVEQKKGLTGVAFGKHLGQFVANPFTRNLMNPAPQLLDRGKCFRLDGVSEAGGKAYRTQHSQFVFGEAYLGPADGANDSGVKVPASTHEIQNFIPEGIEQKSVDGKVAALDIFLSTFAETYLVRMGTVTVADVAAQGCDLARIPDG